jgi:hypothetical protein
MSTKSALQKSYSKFGTLGKILEIRNPGKFQNPRTSPSGYYVLPATPKGSACTLIGPIFEGIYGTACKGDTNIHLASYFTNGT